MQIRVRRIEDGPACVEVIDSTDGAVAHCIDLNAGQEVVINSPTATSPANIEVGEVTAIEADPAAGEPDPAANGEQASSAEGAEAPTDPEPPAAA